MLGSLLLALPLVRFRRPLRLPLLLFRPLPPVPLRCADLPLLLDPDLPLNIVIPSSRHLVQPRRWIQSRCSRMKLPTRYAAGGGRHAPERPASSVPVTAGAPASRLASSSSGIAVRNTESLSAGSRGAGMLNSASGGGVSTADGGSRGGRGTTAPPPPPRGRLAALGGADDGEMEGNLSPSIAAAPGRSLLVLLYVSTSCMLLVM